MKLLLLIHYDYIFDEHVDNDSINDQNYNDVGMMTIILIMPTMIILVIMITIMLIIKMMVKVTLISTLVIINHNHQRKMIAISL